MKVPHMIKYLLEAQLDELKNVIGNRLLTHLKNGQVNKFECYAKESLISFDWYNLRDVNSKPTRITVCYAEDRIFFICEDDAGLKKVRELVTEDPSEDRVLYTFFSGLIRDDIDYLEDLEEHVTEIEDRVISDYKGFKQEYGGEIIALRRELLKLKRYYEQLNEIFEGLMENENGLISEENLRYFRILDSKIDRLFSHVLNLRDYVTQVREAYQAQIDIEQNSLMKIFTVITSIFLPLTLLVGWYGMNLQMPEFNWPFGYPFVILLSVIVVIVSIVIFKRRKWL
jgi:magnesium transporter